MSRLYLATLHETPKRGVLLELHENERASEALKLKFPGYNARVACMCCISQEQVDQIPKLLEGRGWPLVFAKRVDLWAHDKNRLQNESAPIVSSWPALHCHLTEAGNREDELQRYQVLIGRALQQLEDIPGFDPNKRFSPEQVIACFEVLEHATPSAFATRFYPDGDMPAPKDPKKAVYGFRDEPEQKAAEEERHERRNRYQAPKLKDAFKKGRR